MALSNIFREPRRELTESVVGLVAGIAVLGSIALADFLIALCLVRLLNGTIDVSMDEFRAAMLLGLVVLLCMIPVALITHALGEGVCDTLQARGIHLRPRNRPKR